MKINTLKNLMFEEHEIGIIKRPAQLYELDEEFLKPEKPEIVE